MVSTKYQLIQTILLLKSFDHTITPFVVCPFRVAREAPLRAAGPLPARGRVPEATFKGPSRGRVRKVCCFAVACQNAIRPRAWPSRVLALLRRFPPFHPPACTRRPQQAPTRRPFPCHRRRAEARFSVIVWSARRYSKIAVSVADAGPRPSSARHALQRQPPTTTRIQACPQPGPILPALHKTGARSVPSRGASTRPSTFGIILQTENQAMGQLQE